MRMVCGAIFFKFSDNILKIGINFDDVIIIDMGCYKGYRFYFPVMSNVCRDKLGYNSFFRFQGLAGFATGSLDKSKKRMPMKANILIIF